MNPATRPATRSAETLALLADALVWPLLLLRRDSTLVHANRAAVSVLRRRQPLLLHEGRVQLCDAAHAAALAAAVEQAADGASRLLYGTGAGACTLAVSPVGPAPPIAGTRPPANGLVLLALSMAASNQADSSAFADAHGLTLAESRVLQQLAQGQSPTQAADSLGVAVATIRSQTLAIRRKTGHASVAQLVSALALGSPLAPPPGPARAGPRSRITA